MTQYTILDQTFELSDEAKIALEKYTARIESAIRKYGHGSDARDDIFLRIREKLEQASHEQETVKLDTIIRIMSDIGEPEEIFQYTGNQTRPSDVPSITKEDVKDFFQREFHRDQKSGIILGVCAGLAETFEINPLWIRVLFVVCTIAWGSGIIVYLVLAILLPDASRREKNSPPIKEEHTVERQANECVQDIQSRAEEYSSGKGAFSGVFRAIGAFLGWIGRWLAVLVRFGFFGLLSLILAMSAIALIASGAILSTRIITDMQDIFAYIPQYTGWIIALAGIAGGILAIMSIGKAFGKSIGNGWVVIICLVILGSALFTGIRSALIVAPHYANGYSRIQSNTFTVASGSMLSIEESYGSTTGLSLEIASGDPSVFFDRSPDNTLRVSQETSIRAGSKEEGDRILAVARSIEITFTWGVLRLTRPSGANFSQKVPFALMRRSITVLVPDGVDIRIPKKSGWYSWQENITPSASVNILRHGDCSGLIARYDPTEASFVCEDPTLRIDHVITGMWIRDGRNSDETSDSFDLRSDGSITSTKEFPYIRWKIASEELILTTSDNKSNRYRIDQLDEHSLILEANSEYIEYRRSDPLQK